jgi:uncharacterized protein (TIGR00290 family)
LASAAGEERGCVSSERDMLDRTATFPEATLVSWSGGKDSAMALLELQRSGSHDVRGLITTVNREDGRIGFHGVTRELVRAQAGAIGLPFFEIPLPPAASNADYEATMRAALTDHAVAGVTAIAYGDLFLKDIRAYRETLSKAINLRPLFPVWGSDTRQFMADFIAKGFRAIVVSVDLERLDASFAGRTLDADFVADLPPEIDPCGENGEFHSFVFDGPNFLEPLKVARSGYVERAGFGYCGLELVRP